MLIGYAFLILAETVFIRKPFAGEHLKLELFWSWRAWSVQKEQILANVIMFLPVGMLVGWIWRWKGLWAAAELSIFIEILQRITARGLCEFDDVFHNMIGAAIGVGIVMIGRKLFKGETE
jgi:glycopeptide antibiotics resistance protein